MIKCSVHCFARRALDCSSTPLSISPTPLMSYGSHPSSASLIRNKLFPSPAPSHSGRSSRYASPIEGRPNAPPVEDPRRYTYRPDNTDVVSDYRVNRGAPVARRYSGMNEDPSDDEWGKPQSRPTSPPRGTRRWWDESGRVEEGRLVQRRAPPSDDGYVRMDAPYGDTRFGELAGDVSTVADLHRAMRDMEVRKDAEIESLKQELRRKDKQITQLEEAVHVAVRALDAEAATASYLSHSADRRDTQSLFWHWRCRYLTRMNKRLGNAILDLHKLLNASVTISSVVHENKKAAISKAMAELAVAEGNLAICRSAFFQAMSAGGGVAASPGVEGRRLTAGLLASPFRASSSQSLGRLPGEEDDAATVSAISDDTDGPTPLRGARPQEASPAAHPSASAEEAIADVADRYRVLAQEYAEEMETVVQARMGVVCTNINAAFDQYNITNHVLTKLAAFAELAESINPLLRGEAKRAAANTETEKALSKLQESKEQAARDEVARAVGVDVDFASLLNMPDVSSPRRPQRGKGLGVVSPSLLAHTASIDIHRDAHHALVATTALPPLINLLKAGVQTLTPALAKSVQHAPSNRTPMDYLPLAVSTVTNLFYDSLEQSILRAPMTAVHDMLLRRWMDHHLRLPGSHKGPGGENVSALDDRRHHTIADGDFTKEVHLADVSIFIQPLVRDGGSFGDTMRRVRQQHAQSPGAQSPQRARGVTNQDVTVVRDTSYPYAVKRVNKSSVRSASEAGETHSGGRGPVDNEERRQYVQEVLPSREDELDEAATRLADAMLMKKTPRSLQHKFEGVGGFSSAPVRHLMHVMSRSSPPRYQSPASAPYLRPESIRRFGSSTVASTDRHADPNVSNATSLNGRAHDQPSSRTTTPQKDQSGSALRFFPPPARPVPSTITPVIERHMNRSELTEEGRGMPDQTPLRGVSPVRGRHQDHQGSIGPVAKTSSSNIYLFEGVKSVSPGEGLKERSPAPTQKEATASVDRDESSDVGDAEEFRSLASGAASAMTTPRTSGSPTRRRHPSAFRRPQGGDEPRPVSPSPRLPPGRRTML